MKTNRTIAGWSLWDLIVVIASCMIMFVLATVLMPRRQHKAAQRISCVNNLKQIGTGYRVWAGDNNDRMHWNVPLSDGGWRELLGGTNAGIYCWTNYAIMANELGQSPRVVVCPGDERNSATNFSTMDNRAVSYFAGLASDVYPQSILGGDRNLAPGLSPRKDYGYSPANNRGNDVILSTNSQQSPTCWSLKMHSQGNTQGAGNLLLGDGSVQQASSARLRAEYQPNAGMAIAADTVITNGPVTYPSFRLIFP